MVNPVNALLIGVLVILLGAVLFWPKKGLFYWLKEKKRISETVLVEHIAKDIQKKGLDGEKLDKSAIALMNEIDEDYISKVIFGMVNDGLVEESDGFLILTKTGQDLATRVIRAHRIYERYLADQTGFGESEWHEQADSYEHVLSAEQVEELSKKLGHPVYDPHGDLIPTKEGEYYYSPSLLLSDAPLNKTLQITTVPDEPVELASIVLEQNIVPLEKIMVTDSSLKELRFVHDGNMHLLPKEAAKFVGVKIVENEAEEAFVNSIPLSNLLPGQASKVEHISPHIRGQERRRLMDLGILKGTVIAAEFKSPSGDPTAYLIRGATIALRKEQADQIIISPKLEVE